MRRRISVSQRRFGWWWRGVCVWGGGSSLRNCQVVRRGWRGPEDELEEHFNCPLKQGGLTLLTMPPHASPSTPSTRGTAYAHILAARGNLSLSAEKFLSSSSSLLIWPEQCWKRSSYTNSSSTLRSGKRNKRRVWAIY